MFLHRAAYLIFLQADFTNFYSDNLYFLPSPINKLTLLSLFRYLFSPSFFCQLILPSSFSQIPLSSSTYACFDGLWYSSSSPPRMDFRCACLQLIRTTGVTNIPPSEKILVKRKAMIIHLHAVVSGQSFRITAMANMLPLAIQRLWSKNYYGEWQSLNFLLYKFSLLE